MYVLPYYPLIVCPTEIRTLLLSHMRIGNIIIRVLLWNQTTIVYLFNVNASGCHYFDTVSDNDTILVSNRMRTITVHDRQDFVE